MKTRWLGAAFFLLLVPLACSSGGDELECESDEKICEDLDEGGPTCVSTNSPTFGCAAASCVPCAPLNAVAVCNSRGTCDYGACDAGFADCDSDRHNGCETNVASDISSCGACSKPCNLQHVAQYSCEQGNCGIAECKDGYADENSTHADGCEAEL